MFINNIICAFSRTYVKKVFKYLKNLCNLFFLFLLLTWLSSSETIYKKIWQCFSFIISLLKLGVIHNIPLNNTFIFFIHTLVSLTVTGMPRSVSICHLPFAFLKVANRPFSYRIIFELSF